MSVRRFVPVKKVAVRVIDGEAVMLTVEDSRLHRLNPTATLVWEGVEADRDFDAIVDTVCESYDVERDRAEADVLALLTALTEKGIVEPGEG